MLLPFLNLVRLLSILLTLLPIFVFSKKRAIFLFFQIAGPSFLKLGQLLSVRQDLVGEEIALTLAKFQDNVKPFSYEKLSKIINQEFDQNFDKIFKEFNQIPIASASIAQVHKAQLISGEIVAVKILRPNIQKMMMRDILTLKLLAKLCSVFSPFLNKTCIDIAELLSQTAKFELDLLHEGANGSKLAEDMKGVKGFFVPKIFWQYSSNKILISEWIDGIPFSNTDKILQTTFDKKIIAQNLVLAYFQQVYVHGFFHADMHPGNLFLKDNGDIAVVDFGIVGKIDKKTRIAVAEVLIGFLHRDYDKIAKIHIDAGFVPADTNLIDLSLSCRKIGEMIVGVNVKDISIAKLLTALIDLTKNYKMEAKPELLLLQKTLLLVEGVGVSLDEHLNIWDLARPFVKKWAKTNIGFDAKIRDAIVDLFSALKEYLKNK
ncbi:MAG: AarF/UbiB family protein [Alphaproteobacteria bacterium]